MPVTALRTRGVASVPAHAPAARRLGRRVRRPTRLQGPRRCTTSRGVSAVDVPAKVGVPARRAWARGIAELSLLPGPLRCSPAAAASLPVLYRRSLDVGFGASGAWVPFIPRRTESPGRPVPSGARTPVPKSHMGCLDLDGPPTFFLYTPASFIFF